MKKRNRDAEVEKLMNESKHVRSNEASLSIAELIKSRMNEPTISHEEAKRYIYNRMRARQRKQKGT